VHRSESLSVMDHKQTMGVNSKVLCCVTLLWQTYTAVFEVAIEGTATSKALQMTRPLTFDLVGEGHLPTVRVSAPTLRNRSGLPLLLFRRLLVGRTQTLQLVLTNEGALQSQVHHSFHLSFY